MLRLTGDYTYTVGLLNANLLLYKIYKEKGIRDSTLKYLEAADVLKDLLFNNAKANEAQNIALHEEVKQRELNEQKAEQQIFLMLSGSCCHFVGCRHLLIWQTKRKRADQTNWGGTKEQGIKSCRWLAAKFVAEKKSKAFRSGHRYLYSIFNGSGRWLLWF